MMADERELSMAARLVAQWAVYLDVMMVFLKAVKTVVEKVFSMAVQLVVERAFSMAAQSVV